jgi:hypothetical protein
MSETITLPRSGIVLTRRGPDSWLNAEAAISLSEWPSAWIAYFGSESQSGPKDEMLSWLDARVLALRAALMPPDARERIARAFLREHEKLRRDRAYDRTGSVLDLTEESIAMLYADAVLKVLSPEVRP